MSVPVNQLVQSLLQKESLDQCSIRELRELSDTYPFFDAFQFLLAKKLSSTGDEAYHEQFQKALVFFQHPLWLEHLINDAPHDASIETRAASSFIQPENIQEEKTAVEEIKDAIPPDDVERSISANQDWEKKNEPVMEEKSAVMETSINQEQDILGDHESIQQVAEVTGKEKELEQEINLPPTPIHESSIGKVEWMHISSPAIVQAPDADQSDQTVPESSDQQDSIPTTDKDKEHQEEKPVEHTAVEESSLAQIADVEAREDELVKEVNTPLEESHIAIIDVAAEQEPIENPDKVEVPGIELLEEPIPDHPIAMVENDEEKTVAINEEQGTPPELPNEQGEQEIENTDNEEITQWETDKSLPPLPSLKMEPIDPSKTELSFEPYHTVDYFASQGIKFNTEEKPMDKFGKQLKSFTEWLKAMKRLPPSAIEEKIEETTVEKVAQLAEHSIEDRIVVTEAMAAVWEKQGNYAKAIEIYDKLSLLDPSKSRYFAAKIDLLKKST